MTRTRFYLPEITRYDEVYTLEELHEFFQRGELTEEDIAADTESGMTYLIGDLMEEFEEEQETVDEPLEEPKPIEREFRGDIPLMGPPPRPPEREVPEVNYDTRPFLDAEDDDELEGEIDDEEYCLYEGHPSWWSYPRLLLFVILGLASVVICILMGLGFEWWLFLGAMTGVLATFTSILRITTTYVVTNKRVELETGLIGSSTKEVRITDIRAIDVTQKGWDSVLGIGTIHFDSSATAGPEVTFRRVRAPHEIKKMVRELQN